jgi:hypothetical protein
VPNPTINFTRGFIFRLLAILLLFTVFTAEGQKVKYKDLFVLLNAKKYNEAEPFLRSFLSDPKNADEPNANFQMGKMLQSQAEELDIVNQTDLYNAKIDTAITYYRKSLELIDEKEVKKRDEYYEDYFRRDLRSGKMGVKLSDVHLDIENIIEDLSSRADRINKMKDSYLMSIRFYDGCLRVYERMVQEHKSYNQLLLRGRDGIVSEMDSLQIYYDSLIVRREHYFNLREALEKYFEKPVWEQLEIKQYQIELQPLDLQAELIKTWDFKTWAVQSRELIIDETRPLQESMVAYDARLAQIEMGLLNSGDTLREEVSSDMVIVNTIMKYDNDAIPIKLFNYRVKKIEYLNQLNTLKSLELLDTADLQIKERSITEMADQTEPLSFIFNSIKEYDEEFLGQTYETFLKNRYDGVGGFTEYLQNEKEYIDEQKQSWNDSLVSVQERQKYIVFNEDRIFLAPGSPDSVTLVRYTPVVSVDSVYGVLSSGWYHSDADTLVFYFISTDATQVADTIGFATADPVFQASSIMTSAIAGYNPLQEDWVILYFLRTPTDSVYHGNLFRFGKRNLVVWSQQINLSSVPESIEYVPESLHFNLYLSSEEGVEPKRIIIDTEGNILEENQ